MQTLARQKSKGRSSTVFSSYHNTKAKMAMSNDSVRDIDEDGVAMGNAPLDKLPVA